MREAKRKGATVLGIVNVVGSTIARETDGGVYIHAGPEIGVASTKAFTSPGHRAGAARPSCSAACAPCQRRAGTRAASSELQRCPEQVQQILDQNDADPGDRRRSTRDHNNFLYLGRGCNFPVALEGALKLKEISYIHAEGYPAAEMKHGPIALIDENMPVVVIVPARQRLREDPRQHRRR